MSKKIKKANGNASLVLGIAGLVFFLAPYIGVVLSILAVIFGNKQTPKTPNGNAGKVMGIIGICVNGLMLLFMLVFWNLIMTAATV